MKLTSRSAAHHHQLPTTQVYQQLNNQLTICLRSWGSTEFNQKVIDEVTHYLSTTQADIEVTTPFDYLESLSSLANRTRVALLLAHDLLYKTDNRNEYVVGFEVLILFRNKAELAWSSVGRFSISKLVDDRLNTILNVGSDLDKEMLLPVQLIGLEKDITVYSGSISIDESSKIVLSSTYGCDVLLVDATAPTSNMLEVQPSQSTYWFSVVTVG